MPRALILFALAGCYTESDYVSDLDLASCEKVFACSDESVLPYLPYDDVDACLDFRADQVEDPDAPLGEDCAYDAAQAKDCVAQLTDLSCEAWDDGALPESCGLVCAVE